MIDEGAYPCFSLNTGMLLPCLNQICRPKIHVSHEGCGDCTICQSHPDNVHCKSYTPITVYTFMVEPTDEPGKSCKDSDA